MTLQRFLTRLIWLTILPMLVLALGLSYAQFTRARDDDGTHAEQVAARLSLEIDRLLDARVGALRMLARSPLLEEPRWPELYREAQGIREGFSGHIILVDDQRRMRFQTNVPFGDPLPPLPRPAGRAAIPLAFQTARSAVGDPFTGPLVRETMVAVAVPVVRDGRVAAVLANIMPVRQLGALLDALELPPAWIASLHDTGGRPMLQRGGASGDAEPHGDSQAMLRFAAQPTAVPWTVEVRIPRTTYAQHLAGVGARLILPLLAVTLLSVLVGRWGTRRLGAAVRSLVEPSPAAARGDEIDEIRAVRRMLDDAAAQREAVARALQVREQQLRGIFDSASEAIVTTDDRQVIVLANAAAARTFGWPLSDMVGAPLERLIPERLRARHRANVDRFGRDESAARAMVGRPDVVGLRADGSEFPIEAAISQVHVGEQRLYTVILRDVTQRRRLEAQLRASHADLARLVAAQQSVEEEERKRIARELHDELQQVLAAIKMDVAAIESALAADPKQVPALATRIDDLATAAITSSRRIVNDLRPLLLEELGLTAALEAMARQFADRTGIPIRVDSDEHGGAGAKVPDAVATCLYRAAQEALNNVAKHAGASCVWLTLSMPAGGALRLTVTDDGRGVRPEDRGKPTSFGLRGMAERVRALGGSLRVETPPSGGVSLIVEIDMARAAEEAPA